mmetsp:Transcript_8739/g.15336  ORF Transcript_8739/g.15336 Transcript_8739/m.15336 type:complete len:111 (-) Transcript_8739:291-623(-)
MHDRVEGGLPNLNNGGYDGYAQHDHSHHQLNQQQPLATAYEHDHEEEVNEPPLTTYDYRNEDEANADVIIEEEEVDDEEWDQEDIGWADDPQSDFREVCPTIVRKEDRFA